MKKKCTARNYTDEHSVGELTDDGVIKWKSGIVEKMHAKANFENKKCLKCRLLPLCGGPCMQRTIEFDKGILNNICGNKSEEMDVNTFIHEYYLSVKKQYKIISA